MKKIAIVCILMIGGVISVDIIAEKLFFVVRDNLFLIPYTESKVFLLMIFTKALGYFAIFDAGILMVTPEKEKKNGKL